MDTAVDRGENMKRASYLLLWFGLAGVLTAAVVACGQKGQPPSEPDSTPVILSSQNLRPYRGAAVASVEERTFMSDVVVRARFVSAGNDVLRFQSIEYLKGAGPSAFTVMASTDGRDTRWDDQDAILFLKQLNAKKENFTFTDSANSEGYIQYAGDLPEGYTLGTRNPVWLPVVVTSTGNTLGGQSSSRSVSGAQPANGLNIITENDEQGSPAISQRDLRDTISWLAGPSQSGGALTQRSSNNRATERYQTCISFALSFIRWERDKDAYYGPAEKPTRWDFQIGSGLTQGTEIFDMSFGTERGAGYAVEDVDYDTYTTSGESAHLFQSLITDADANPVTGYSYAVTTMRPLPAGVYSFRHEVRLFEDVPCNFKPRRCV